MNQFTQDLLEAVMELKTVFTAHDLPPPSSIDFETEGEFVAFHKTATSDNDIHWDITNPEYIRPQEVTVYGISISHKNQRRVKS